MRRHCRLRRRIRASSAKTTLTSVRRVRRGLAAANAASTAEMQSARRRGKRSRQRVLGSTSSTSIGTLRDRLSLILAAPALAAAAVALVIGMNDTSNKLVTHDVRLVEFDDADALHALERCKRV